VEAWLALRDRPQDINQQMTTWLYTAFSLACEEGRCEMAEMLIEAGADTSLPNHVGETGLDIARSKAKHRPHETKYSDTVTMLEKWTKKPGHMLQTEEQRNLSRPVQSVPKERPEIGIDRLGYWDAHHSAPSKQYRRFVKLNEGAYGWVTKVPVDIPVRDSSGKLHYEAAAKSTKASSSDDSSDAGTASAGTKQNKSSQSSQAEAEVKALSSEIQTLHKLDRANDPSSLSLILLLLLAVAVIC
jgi:cobalamin biosynthesis Mg chelatase CobN